MSWRVLLVAALLSLALGATLFQGGASERVLPPSTGRSATSTPKGLSSLPLAAQGQISAVVGADERAYRISPSSGGFQAANPAQGLRAHFDGRGLSVSSGTTQVGLRLRAVGYGTRLTTLDQVAPSLRANRVLYRHAAVTEWYANGPLGLEQGFTVLRAPSGHPAGALTLSMALSGEVHASLGAAGLSIVLSRSGGPFLRYGGLSATDAHGRALHSWLALRDGQLLLRVDTRGARYPLHIDPFIQQGEKLAGGGEGGAGRFGWSVALASDGNTALIGGPYDDGGVGAAWVFTRSGSTWTQQGEKLTGGQETGDAEFGWSVALSSDGNTALIGGRNTGAWVFTRSGERWTQQGEKLTNSSGAYGFGWSVALSSSGNTALVGGQGLEPEAWVFRRSGSTWSQQAGLTAGGQTGEGHWDAGSVVALSSDGNTALLGWGGDNNDVGAAWAFTRSGETWSQQGKKLTGSSESGGGGFGSSVALSSDGNTALIGSYSAEAVWAFTRSGETWSQQGEKLTGSGESTGSQFGISVALSSDGNTALIGGPYQSPGVGAVWEFTRTGETWTQRGGMLTGGGEAGLVYFGTSVALSSEANTALIGGYADNSYVGAAWVFSTKPTVTNVSPNYGPEAGGTEVTITGTNLAEATAVDFGSTSATSFHVDSETSITALSPAGTGLEDVTVTNPGGTSTASPADQFSYLPAPTVTSVSPNTGSQAGGSEVTITGTNFTYPPVIKFGTTPVTDWHFNGSSETSITAISPPGTGTVDVTVTTAGGTSATSPADVFSYLPPPIVTTVNPNEGPEAGGTSVTVTGSNLAEATAVRFGAASASSWHVNSATSITVVSPAGTGTVDVTVTGPYGTSATSAADRFHYLPAPTVTVVSPKAGAEAGGTVVSISGTSFTGATAVEFGLSPAASFHVNSATSITAVSPAGTAGAVDVTVTAAGGTSFTSFADEFSYLPPPEVASVNPTTGPEAGGTSVTITGGSLAEAGAVRFGAASATSFHVDSETSITAISPPGTGTVDVTVTTAGGTSATSPADVFSYLPPPIVTTVNPNEGPEAGGTSVTVTGSNLAEATAVRFGAAGASSWHINSATSITAVSPAGTGTVDVTVTGPYGTSATSAADRFHYLPAPSVTKVTPSKGAAAGGTSVTITGRNYTEPTAVKFGATNAASFHVNSATSVTAVSPAGTAGAVHVTVTTPGGTSAVSSYDQFKFEAPTVTKVSPDTGSRAGGISVTLSGTGFAPGSTETSFEFGATRASTVNCASTTTCTAVTPAHKVGTVDVKATVNKMGSPRNPPADQFVYS